jgi:UrcA family protein
MTSHTFTSKSFTRAALMMLASGFVAVTATAANAAQSEAQAPAVSISYADLNLATEQGTVALYRRIVSAAHRVCDTNTGPNARLAARAQHCVNEAVARAVHDVQSPKLAELQAARSRRVDRG